MNHMIDCYSSYSPYDDYQDDDEEDYYDEVAADDWRHRDDE